MDAITYALSKKYTDSKITESTGLHREIVNSLPSTGDNSIIYMVLDPNASSPDVYDEWLWVNGTYEHIGSTRVDLTDYYNKTQIDAALSGKANTATTLSGYGISDAYTKTETDTALSGKANTSDIPTALSGLSDDSTHRLVTDAEKGTWNGKANTATSLSGYGITDAYTKTEVNTALSGKISSSEKGVSNGVAELDANGKIPSSQLPSYVDDTIEGYLYEGKWYSDSSHTHEVAGETEKIYVELSTNKTYRWSGSVFVEISESLALGETSSTAYRGDRGKEAYDHSQSDHSGVTPTFTEASTRANIATGESIATIFGKIKKFFSDLKAVAFTGSYNDLLNTPDLSLKADKTAVDDVYSVMGQNGAKNLIPYPYYETTKTVNGVTFTDNGDGTITVSGTASADVVFGIRNVWSASDLVELLPNTIYAFSGCPVGGSVSTYLIQFVNEKSDLSDKSWLDDTGTGGTLTTTDVKRFVGSRIVIKSGTAFSTPVTFKPMLRLASDTDNTYQPYAKTNKQLTEDKAELASVRDYVNELGVKNLIPYPFYETTKTQNGVTFTDNGDGSITVDTAGEASTGNAIFYCQTPSVVSNLIKLDKNKTYILSDTTKSSVASTYTLGIRYFAEGVVPSTSTGTAVSCNSTNNWQAKISNAVSAYVYIYVYSGKTVNNITFKPMLRLASDINDDTYVQYAKTNKELTNDIDDVYKTMGEVGAKNLIPYPYTNAYRTTEGVTITEGSIKGSCVFNGTSTGRVDAQLGYRSSNALTLLPSEQYCLSIKTDGSFVGNLAVEAWNKGTTTYAKSIARVTPSSTGSDYKEVIFSVTQSDINNYDFAVLIYGNSGNTFNNVTVYPMLRLAADTDNTYEPYAMTNKQLTDQLKTKQDTLTFDNVPTQNSNNPVKSGGIFSTMAVPKYDSANRREYYEGGAAFSGNIDSTPTAGSNNAVASGGTWSALNRKCSVATYTWNLGSVTAGGVYLLENFKNTVGLSDKNIVAVGLVSVVGYGNYDYGASVFYTNDTAKLKTALTQSTTTARLYIIYTD